MSITLDAVGVNRHKEHIENKPHKATNNKESSMTTLETKYYFISLASILLTLTVLLAHTALAQEQAASQLCMKGEEGTDAIASCWNEARAGNPHAQYFIGEMYALGFGKSATALPNNREAIRWYQRAAKQGHEDAMLKLAQRYTTGWGVDRDYATAERWYRRTLETNSTAAVEKILHSIEELPDSLQEILADIHSFGPLEYRNAPRADQQYRQAAQRGNKNALTKLIGRADRLNEQTAHFELALYNESTGENDAAVERYRRAAQLGHGRAQFVLGQYYEMGWIVESDESKAKEWYRKAAHQGHPQAARELLDILRQESCPTLSKDDEDRLLSDAQKGDARAQYKVGVRYFQSCQIDEGTVDNATKWLQKAASQGHVKAQTTLGQLYEREACASDGPCFSDLGEKAMESWRKAAAKGDVEAHYLLGRAHYRGDIVTEDDSVAAQWYASAAEKGHVEAMENLGYLYLFGYGVSEDKTRAFELLHQAARKGSTRGKLGLGHLYRDGSGVFQSDTKAVEWYQQAANENSQYAQYNLALMYADGRGVRRNPAMAIFLLRKVMAQGMSSATLELAKLLTKFPEGSKDVESAVQLLELAASSAGRSGVEAKYRIALLYLGGHTKYRNHHEAMTLLGEAAALGHAEALSVLVERATQNDDEEAQYRLGMLHYKGSESVPRDHSKGFTWLKRAAESGSAHARCAIAKKLYEGERSQMDRDAAFQWHLRAADEGCRHAVKAAVSIAAMHNDVEGQYELGRMYATGNDLSRDVDLAYEWYTRAAMQGHSKAQLILAIGYADGIGLERDEWESLSWLKKAANSGLDEAEYMLAGMYVSGAGVGKDLDAAAEWYDRAAVQGHKRAQYQLGKLYASRAATAKDHRSAMRDYEVAMEWLFHAADQDLVEAQYAVAMSFLDRAETPQDEIEGVKWLMRAAEGGHRYAKYHLGWAFVNGRGVVADERRAAWWFRLVKPTEVPRMVEMAIHLDIPYTSVNPKSITVSNINVELNVRLAKLFYCGLVVARDTERARLYLEELVELVPERILTILGTLHGERAVEAEQLERAEILLTRAATSGDVRAYVQLALLFSRSTSAVGDYSRSITWLDKLFASSKFQQEGVRVFREGLDPWGCGVSRDEELVAFARLLSEDGSVAGKYLLSLLYEFGVGVERSKEKSLEVNKVAADAGYARAQHRMGLMAHRGYADISKNVEEAVSWLRRAAEQGFAPSQYTLYLIYGAIANEKWFDWTVEGPKEKALGWLRKAAAAGYVHALFDLGYYYMLGEEADVLPRDYGAAMLNFERAAALGSSKALFELGDSYALGRGVQIDMMKAKQYYRNAALAGNEKAWERLLLGGKYQNCGAWRNCRPLVAFLGGFAEPNFSLVFYDLLDERTWKYRDLGVDLKFFPRVSYPGHEEVQGNEALRYVEEHLRRFPNSPIALVGHSLGGESAYHVAKNLEPREVTMLVTLDAVGKDGMTDSRPLSNVGFWWNLYQFQNPKKVKMLKGVKFPEHNCNLFVGIGDLVSSALSGAYRYTNAIESAHNRTYVGDHCDATIMFNTVEIPILCALGVCPSGSDDWRPVGSLLYDSR